MAGRRWWRDARLWLAAVLGAWLLFVWLVPASTLMLAVDDAYYYLRIARNVGDGRGITYDGVEPTTGFHPLWLLVVVPLTRIGGGEADVVMRAMLTTNLALVAASAMLLVRHEGARVAMILALFLASFWASKVLVCGQESSLAFLVMTVSFIAAARGARGSVLGVLAGALVWSRFALAPMALGLVLYPLADRRKHALAEAVVAAGTALIVTAPWLAWVHSVDGRFVPVNASTKLDEGVDAAIAFAVLVPIAVVVVARWSATASSLMQGRERLVPFVPLLTQVVAQHAVDLVVRGRLVPEPWSLAPLALFLVLATARLVRGPFGRIVAGGWIASAVAMWLLRLQPSSWSAYAASARTGDWLAAHVSRSATIAGWDSGIIAARAPQRFVNLDGLVHSVAVARAVKHGELRAYLDDVLRPDFVVGYVVPGSTDVKSTELGDLSVVHVECASFRGLFELEPRTYPIVVLAHHDVNASSGPPLATATDGLCAE